MSEEDARMDGEEGEEQDTQTLSQQQDGARPKRRQPAAAGGSGPTAQPDHPCLACGENCGKNKHSVRCVMCTLWAHKNCVKMTDAMFKSLEQQVKEVGTAYWVCRPCQNFGLRVPSKRLTPSLATKTVTLSKKFIFGLQSLFLKIVFPCKNIIAMKYF